MVASFFLSFYAIINHLSRKSEWGRERKKIITRQLISMIFLSLIKLAFISIHSVYFILSIGVNYNGNIKK